MVAGGRVVTADTLPTPEPTPPPPTRPRIGLAYVMELVVGVAVCAGLLRDEVSDPRLRDRLPNAPASEWLRLVGETSLTGLALVGGLGLAVEAIRGRSPATWGLGRWIWSIAGSYAVLNIAANLAYAVVRRLLDRRVVLAPEMIAGLLRYLVRGQMLTEFVWALTAVCLTAAFARAPRDPSPDAREWAGRIYASLVIALEIALRALQAMGR